MGLSNEENVYRRGPEGDDIEAARERAEAASNDGGTGPRFENGFTWKVIAGAFFIGLIMMPGSIYLGLVAGQSLGPAAQWVTIVLFSEIARRSFLPLKRQEIYCIYYIAGTLVATGFAALSGISGGPFGSFIALQYLMQSPALANVAPHLPGWVAPHVGSPAYDHRTFLDQGWLLPIAVLLFGYIFDRMKWMGLGFILFKITSDVEKLPFPMAPIAASGATALAEANTKEESWRWRIFSIGSIIGLVWGLFYLVPPIVGGVLLHSAIMLIPIPFFDLTPTTERSLPTALTGINPDIGNAMLGFVVPYQIVLGSFVSSWLCQVVANPILHNMHMFPHWHQGGGTIPTQIAINFDFWLSFGIGIQLAIAVVGIVSVVIALIKSNRAVNSAERGSLMARNLERGDFPIVWAAAAWLAATLGYIALNHALVPGFSMAIVAFYGLVWTPLNSYISARMIALTGSPVTFPYLNQAVVMQSGYHGSDIWFAPLPLNDYGSQAQKFRELELTGTKFSSIVKLELAMAPIVLVFSFIYWGFLWHTSQIPSAQFTWAQKFWPAEAVTKSVWLQINSAGGEGKWVLNAIKPHVIETGMGVGLVLYGITIAFKLPLLFYYGLMSGSGSLPHNTLGTFVGALLGRYYFAKKLGVERWTAYGPVVLAGFACGTGLIGLAAIAFALIAKTINYLQF